MREKRVEGEGEIEGEGERERESGADRDPEWRREFKKLHFTSKKLYFDILTVHNISLKNNQQSTIIRRTYYTIIFLGEPA